MLKKHEKRIRRHKRVRAKIIGTAEVPRLYVFRSSKHIYTQVIDDEKGKTLAAASDQEIKRKVQIKKKKTKEKDEKKEIIRTAKIAIAYEVGKLIAERTLKMQIKKIVFDRGGYKYHGRVRAVAEGARDAGLEF